MTAWAEKVVGLRPEGSARNDGNTQKHFHEVCDRWGLARTQRKKVIGREPHRRFSWVSLKEVVAFPHMF